MTKVAAAETTGPADWIALIFYLFTCVVFVFILITFCRYRKDPHYRWALFHNLMGLAIFAIFHLTGVFVANEYITGSNVLNSLMCPLWNFFLQYLLGVGLWITFLLQRLLYYMSLSTHTAAHKDTWLYKSNTTNLVMFLIIMPPIMIICLCTIWADGSVSVINSRDEKTCENKMVWKIIVAIWIGFIWVLSLLVIVYTYGSGKLRNPQFDERLKCAIVLFSSMIVIVVNAIMAFTGSLDKSIPRSINMIILCVFYFASFMMLIQSVWKTQPKFVKDSSEEALLYLTRVNETIDAVPDTQDKLRSNEPWMRNFMNYCRSRLQAENDIMTKKHLATGDTYIDKVEDLACVMSPDEPGLDEDTKKQIKKARDAQSPENRRARLELLKETQKKHIIESIENRKSHDLPTTTTLLGCLEQIKSWKRMKRTMDNEESYIIDTDVKGAYKQLMTYVNNPLIYKIPLDDEDVSHMIAFGTTHMNYNAHLFDPLQDKCISLLLDRYFVMWNKDLHCGKYRSICEIRKCSDDHRKNILESASDYMAETQSSV